MTERTPFHERVAGTLIDDLRAGTAPWQLPWEPGVPYLPTNPRTLERYRAINMVRLLMERRSDPRWMTYRQAKAHGAQVREGERGTTIEYWMFAEQRDGVTGRLERPRPRYGVVFNAEQIEGLPALEYTPRPWDAIERTKAILKRAAVRTQDGIKRAETILKTSGAKIEHAPGRAFYDAVNDSIRLPYADHPDQSETQSDISHPFPEQLETEAKYYATALHELGHWTGHPKRLNRDQRHPFGTEAYAREELRAEIASLILGDELALGHNVTASERAPQKAYVGHWTRMLQRDPLEVSRAALAAEMIAGFVLAIEEQQELGQSAGLATGEDYR